MKLITAIAMSILAIIATGTGSSAAEWNVQPITAHAPDYWKGTPNWTYDAGNPMTDHGAQWILSAQPQKDPTLTSSYIPLQKAIAWKYFFVWGAGANAGGELMHAYRDFNLSTIAADNTPQSGPSTAIRFCPPSEGTYHVDIVATAKVQNPTAGHARATIYILSQDASSATQLAAIDLNKATPDAFGHFPARLNYHADVPLKKNEELAVRIQTVNPGPASAGASELTFEQFRVTGP